MTAETKHTPGPWSVFICDDGGEWTGWPLSISADHFTDKTVVRPGGFYPYAWDAGISQNEAVANARLITAAPDMLAALKVAVDGWGDHLSDGDDYPSWVKPARAVIAKAEGH